MSNFICTLLGSNDMKMCIYDNKCVFSEDEIINGQHRVFREKTIFYKDCICICFKGHRTGGYLRLETACNSNSFDFPADWESHVTHELMRDVYNYITERIEGYKYNDKKLIDAPIPVRLTKLRNPTGIFIEKIKGATSYITIADEWEEQGLSGNPLYLDLETEIMKYAKLERIKGAPTKMAIDTFVARLETAAFLKRC